MISPTANAAEIGLVTYSVPRAQLEEEVQKLMKKLCDKEPNALRACKEAYRDSLLIPDMDAALAINCLSCRTAPGRIKG